MLYRNVKHQSLSDDGLVSEEQRWRINCTYTIQLLRKCSYLIFQI